MTLKKEFFFLRHQLRKRFSLLLLGIIACLILTFLCNVTAQTYTIDELPEKYVDDFKFMKRAGSDWVTRTDSGMTMNDSIYEYEVKNGQYSIAFVLPLSIATLFTYVVGGMFAYTIIKRIDWHKRFLLEKANRKLEAAR